MDPHGRCPIHVAAMAGRADVVDQLLHHGCDAARVLPVDLFHECGSGSQLDDHESIWMSSFASRAAAESEFARNLSGPKVIPPDAGEDKASHLIKQSTQAPDADGSRADFDQPLVDQSSFIDHLSFKYCNALHLAAYYGHVAVVEILLLQSEIEVDAKNENGCTALHLAANKGHKHVVARLLKASGCSVNTTDCNGLTALHHAAARGHAHVIDVLWPK